MPPDNNKKMSISEYLMFRYKKGVDQLINAKQGENKEEIAKAQSMVDSAQSAVSEMVSSSCCSAFNHALSYNVWKSKKLL